MIEHYIRSRDEDCVFLETAVGFKKHPHMVITKHTKELLELHMQAVFRIRIRIIWPDPDPLQETLIWILVAKKNRDKLAYKSTKIIRI